MSKTLSINTSLSPVYFDKYADNESIVVVIDVLRATSVISTAFHYGVKEIIPVQTSDQALEFKAKENHIVAAERNAMLIDGFDFGNSPFHYMNKDIQDKTLVFTTTNGTKALNMAINHQTITASFVNFDAVADYLINQQQNIILFCSGWKGYFNYGRIPNFRCAVTGWQSVDCCSGDISCVYFAFFRWSRILYGYCGKKGY